MLKKQGRQGEKAKQTPEKRKFKWMNVRAQVPHNSMHRGQRACSEDHENATSPRYRDRLPSADYHLP